MESESLIGKSVRTNVAGVPVEKAYSATSQQASSPEVIAGTWQAVNQRVPDVARAALQFAQEGAGDGNDDATSGS